MNVAEQVSDGQLVKRVQLGDRRAFDLLVLRYQHKIYRLVSRYIKDSHEVPDVVQEAFIKAYRRGSISALANSTIISFMRVSDLTCRRMSFKG